jgi:DNA modification methylase
MMFTDPPYNVAYEGKTKDKLKIQNDSMKNDDFLQFLRDVFVSLSTVVEAGGLAFVCHADSEGANFRVAFSESGFELKQCLVWVKNTLILGRQDYQWRHEPILYGWRSGGAHKFYGDRKNTTVIDCFEGVSVTEVEGRHEVTIAFNGRTVQLSASDLKVEYDGTDEFDSIWRFSKPSRNGEHPTMKPIALCARAIRHGSKKGGLVLDGFLGSGSTLIACEQLGRRCFGTELDPVYCDVIVKRWENLTGEKAVCQPAKLE